MNNSKSNILNSTFSTHISSIRTEADELRGLKDKQPIQITQLGMREPILFERNPILKNSRERTNDNSTLSFIAIEKKLKALENRFKVSQDTSQLEQFLLEKNNLIEILNNENNTLRSSNMDLNQLTEKLKKENIDLLESNENLKNIIQELKLTIEETEYKLQDALKRNYILERDNSEFIKELQSLRNKSKDFELLKLKVLDQENELKHTKKFVPNLNISEVSNPTNQVFNDSIAKFETYNSNDVKKELIEATETNIINYNIQNNNTNDKSNYILTQNKKRAISPQKAIDSKVSTRAMKFSSKIQNNKLDQPKLNKSKSDLKRLPSPLRNEIISQKWRLRSQDSKSSLRTKSPKRETNLNLNDKTSIKNSSFKKEIETSRSNSFSENNIYTTNNNNSNKNIEKNLSDNIESHKISPRSLPLELLDRNSESDDDLNTSTTLNNNSYNSSFERSDDFGIKSQSFNNLNVNNEDYDTIQNIEKIANNQLETKFNNKITDESDNDFHIDSKVDDLINDIVERRKGTTTPLKNTFDQENHNTSGQETPSSSTKRYDEMEKQLLDLRNEIMNKWWTSKSNEND